MIRLTGRHDLVSRPKLGRVLVQQSRTLKTSTPGLYTPPSSHGPFCRCALHINSPFPVRPVWARHITSGSGPSSSPLPESPSTTTPKSSPDLSLPSTSNASPKKKVDLRPAPTKKPIVASSAPPTAPSPTSPSTSSTSSSSSTTSSSTESSTSASTSTTPSSSTSSIPLKTEAEHIMAQAQADIRASESAGILQPPPADASTVGRLWHQAKELFKFYYRGVKMQWTHHQMVRGIRARVASGGSEISRWESQFIRTHQRDLKKLVPFILVLVIIEEILPLIVIYAPFMLPSTTILPSQAERIYEKREEKKRQALTQAKWYAENEKIDPTALSHVSVKELTNDLAWTVCRGFEVSDRGPRSWVNSRVGKHLAYVAHDDMLLRREPGALLTLNELRVALNERGQSALGLSHDQAQERLDRWLQTVKGPEDMVESFLQYAMTVQLPPVAPKAS